MSGAAELPRELPVMKPEMLCRGRLDGPDGTHCLYGWQLILKVDDDENPFDETLCKECVTRHGMVPIRLNDELSATVAADVWNRTSMRLGYQQQGDKFILPETPAAGL